MDDDGLIDLADEFDDDHRPEVLPRGNVMASLTAADGSVLRVATTGNTVRLTLVGSDGMATVALSALNTDLLTSMLGNAQIDAQRAARGF